MIELKPCPFCGGDNVIIRKQEHPAGTRFQAVCPNCMAMVATGTFQCETQAANAWNRRATEKTGVWIMPRKNMCKCSICGTAYNHSVEWIPDKYCSECGTRLFVEGGNND